MVHRLTGLQQVKEGYGHQRTDMNVLMVVTEVKGS